jgi:hypothetical protein
MTEKRKDDENNLWLRFESEVKTQLNDKIRQLEVDLEGYRRTGRKEEMDFAEDVRKWPGIHLGDKLPKNGDYILSYRDPSGRPVDTEILVDNKDKNKIDEDDITKLVRDAKERGTPIAIIVTRDESQLRRADWDDRFGDKDGVLVLRTTRSWLRAELDVLKPIVIGIRTKGPDFLRQNADLAGEVQRTLRDLAEIQKEIGTAAKASKSAGDLLARYTQRLRELCDDCLKRDAASQPGDEHAASTAA